MTARRCRHAGGALWLALSVALTATARAQTDPRLASAVRLAQDGLSDSARAVAGRILAATPRTDSLYPEALYTMGLVAATEQDRRLYFRRVVVDHPESPWADDALLSLAQLDYATGNTASTVRQVEQLLRDYPSSPLTATAAFWGARAAGDRRDGATACRFADAGLAAVGQDVELHNQLDFQKQRCQGIAARVADSIRAAAADSARVADSLAQAAAAAARRPPSRGSPRAPVAGYYVQVSAVRTQSAAATETDRVRQAGFTPTVGKESGYLKIRAGPFRTRSAADRALREIREKLGGRPFVVRLP
jgi:cell division septation protein DedD